jgi:hypothetical protein
MLICLHLHIKPLPYVARQYGLNAKKISNKIKSNNHPLILLSFIHHLHFGLHSNVGSSSPPATASCAIAFAIVFTASHSSAKCLSSPHLRQLILDLPNLSRYFFLPPPPKPPALLFSSATLASHFARVRCSASLSRHPFDDSSNALKRPIVSVATSPPLSPIARWC